MRCYCCAARTGYRLREDRVFQHLIFYDGNVLERALPANPPTYTLDKPRCRRHRYAVFDNPPRRRRGCEPCFPHPIQLRALARQEVTKQFVISDKEVTAALSHQDAEPPLLRGVQYPVLFDGSVKRNPDGFFHDGHTT